MKLASVVFASAIAVTAVSAQTVTVAPVPTTAAPDGNAKVTAPTDAPTAAMMAPSSPAAGGSNSTPTGAGAGGLAALKATPTTDAYHMAPVRVVHARVQSDSPILVEGQLISSFGKGKLDVGYLSSLDSVNTASVEGALMYVQAETINVATRDTSERCVRKTKVANVVFYEILISQTNETIAQFQSDWETPEYSPMIAMDGGACSATEGDKLPPACYQFNGDNKQPNIGPFVGGMNKEKSDRAPYPGNYWFSFPNTCPTLGWAKKTDTCRAGTRKGLCPIGVAPNGVECTFAYNILGWVPIDDIVGITSVVDSTTNKPYASFTEWCKASEDHIEFLFDLASKEVKTSLPFWADPLNETANANRTQVMLDTYAKVLKEGSSQVDKKVAAAFKALPTPEELAKSNPPCYKTVATCGSGTGCKRTGYSQICKSCTAAEKCAIGDGTFKFPTLTKAFTSLSVSETTSQPWTSSSSGGNKVHDPPVATPTVSGISAKSSSVPFIIGTVAGVVALALLVSFVYRRKRRSSNSNSNNNSNNNSNAAAIGSGGAGASEHLVDPKPLTDGPSDPTPLVDTSYTHYTTATATGSSVVDGSGSANAASSLWNDPGLLAVKVSARSVVDVKRIGSGAFADVWLVTYRGSQRAAAKRLRDPTRARTQVFVAEIKLVATLKHPNIVRFIGAAWTQEADLQALFEFVDGGDLRDFLANTQAPRHWTPEKLQIAVDIAEALVYVHSFMPPLVHRDLKSRNVLLGTDSDSGLLRAKLTDFGVSRYHSDDNTMTTGIGTCKWLAPEVIVGDGTYGPAADIFSFGVVLSELDTHSVPYENLRSANGNPLAQVAMLQRVASGELTPSFLPSCPHKIMELAQQCLALRPEDRPSAPQVAYALRTYIKSMQL